MARTLTREILRSRSLTTHGLTAGQSLVLLALADHADASRECFPSQELLALEIGMSRLGVRKSIAALAQKELIEILDPGGPRRSAHYRLRM